MSRSKQKGTAAETAVVRYLADTFPLVERRALHGAADRGDIAGVRLGREEVVVEVKNCKAITLAEWMKELEAEKRNAGASIGAVVAKKRGTTKVGDWYAILSVDDPVALLKKAGAK